MTAPNVAARTAANEARPDAPESLRSRVVEAMHQAVCDCGSSDHGVYVWAADMLALADAAIAVITTPADGGAE